MTAKADFTEQEWETVLQGPGSAGLLVAASQRGGTFRESFSIAKAYTDARQRHGQSELLDDIVSAKPKLDRAHAHSTDELKAAMTERLTSAMTVLEGKAAEADVDAYRGFVVEVAQRVAEAHREGFLGFSGDRVSDAEKAAVAEVAKAVGAPAP
jgi:hypothetical protein